MRIALYQPDIPQNTGAILRLCACFGVGLDIIEPCGFPLSDTKLKRVGMDYTGLVDVVRHTSWDQFYAHITEQKRRLILLTTKTTYSYVDFSFSASDILLLGRESSGVPDDVHQAVHGKIKIPLVPEARSLNVAVSGAIALAEGLRQTGQLPQLS